MLLTLKRFYRWPLLLVAITRVDNNADLDNVLPGRLSFDTDNNSGPEGAKIEGETEAEDVTISYTRGTINLLSAGNNVSDMVCYGSS